MEISLPPPTLKSRKIDRLPLPLLASEAELLAVLNATAKPASWRELSNLVIETLAPNSLQQGLKGKRFFIETAHPYIHSSRGGLQPSEIKRAQRLADSIRYTIKKLGGKAESHLFIDDIHNEQGLVPSKKLSKWCNVSVESSPCHNMQECTVGASFWSAITIPPALGYQRVILESNFLGGGMLFAGGLEKESKGLKISGKERKKLQLPTGKQVYLWERGYEGSFPSCDILEWQYRQYLRNICRFHGGVIIVPERFRAQQERALELQCEIGGADAIFSLLI